MNWTMSKAECDTGVSWPRIRACGVALLGAVAGLALTSAAAEERELRAAATAGEGAFAADNQTATLSCTTGQAAITGSDNALTIEGGCTSVSIAGNNNRITVALTDGASITLMGSDNSVRWTGPAAVPPVVNDVGRNNRLELAPP
jgi:hypothetical protein